MKSCKMSIKMLLSLFWFVVLATNTVVYCENSCAKDGDIGCSNEVVDFPEPFIDESLNELDQEDPKLIEIIKNKLLFPPSKLPYNFTNKLVDMNGQFGQPLVVEKMLRNLKKGFFIEAGAYDGEILSNTILFELKHLWSGLLVEPGPLPFKKLKTKHRRSWSLNHCLSTKNHPEVVEFDAAGLFGGIINPDKKEKPGDDAEAAEERITKEHSGENSYFLHRKQIKVQCFPLYSILMALGNPTVHYLSLDIEGAEFPVLKTIPFDKVDIKVLDIESNHLGQFFEGTFLNLQKFLKRKGYDYMRRVEIDSIFVKRGFDYENFQGRVP